MPDADADYFFPLLEYRSWCDSGTGNGYFYKVYKRVKIELN